MRQLHVPEPITVEPPPPQRTELIGALTVAEGLICDILTRSRDQHTGLQRNHIPLAAPEQPAHAQLRRRQPLRAVIAVFADLFDGLPGGAPDQGDPVG